MFLVKKTLNHCFLIRNLKSGKKAEKDSMRQKTNQPFHDWLNLEHWLMIGSFKLDSFKKLFLNTFNKVQSKL
jgi:hypothetical protein